MSPRHTYQSIAESKSDERTSYSLEAKVWYRRPSIFWLLPVFLMFSLAMGATSMPRMNVVTSLICRKILTERTPDNAPRSSHDMLHNPIITMKDSNRYSSPVLIVIGEFNPQCASKEVESATAMFNLWGNLIAGIIAAAATPFWGKLSDRVGRLKPLAAATCVLNASDLLMILVAKYPDSLSLSWMYLTFVLEGLSGSFILTMALWSSYAADCTKLEDRNMALGWFHGSMSFGMAAGPVLSGYLGMSGGESDPLVIFYAGLGMRTVGILFLPFVPESLKLGRDSERSLLAQLQQSLHEISRGSWSEGLRRTNPLRPLRILYAADTRVDRPTQRNLLALACINTILFGTFMGATNVTMLYSEFQFEWGNKESGTFLFTVNVFRTLVTVLVLPMIIALSRHMSGSRSSPDNATLSNGTGHIDSLDVFLLRISILSNAIGYIGYALSPTGALFTLSGVIASFGAMGLATVEASMTKLLPAAQTGELLGALGLLQALARIIAPTVAGLMYSWTTKTFPQLVFWEFAGCFMLAGLLTWTLGVVVPKHGEMESGFDVHEEEEILILRDRKEISFP